MAKLDDGATRPLDSGPSFAIGDDSTARIERLVADLGSGNAAARHRAHLNLLAAGSAAVVPLINALANHDDLVRLEAVTVLGEIGDPLAATGLVDSLEDPDFGVRWAAGSALVNMGCGSVEPVLRAFLSRSSSLWLRRHGGRVLRKLGRACYADMLEPVFEALKGSEPALQVPTAAWGALQRLEREAA